MRSMKYVCYTLCLSYDTTYGVYSDGDVLTLGSRDKYIFQSSSTDSNAELYVFRFDDGRSQQDEQHEYELKCIELADCDGNTDVYLQTGDILLGVSSFPATQGGAGCSPVLYLLRPLFTRNPSTPQMPDNKRDCGGGQE